MKPRNGVMAISLAIAAVCNTAMADCRDSRAAQDPSSTTKAAMRVGELVGYFTGAAITDADPSLTIVAGDLGCDYGAQFVYALENKLPQFAIGGHLYITTQLQITRELWETSIRYAGPLKETADETIAESAAADLSPVAKAVVTPATAKVEFGAEIAGKIGIDEEDAAKMLALSNAGGVLLEQVASKPLVKIGEVIDETIDHTVGELKDQLHKPDPVKIIAAPVTEPIRVVKNFGRKLGL